MTEITLNTEYQRLYVPENGKVSVQNQSTDGYMVITFENSDTVPANDAPGFLFPKLAIVTHVDDGSFVFIRGTVAGVKAVIK